MSCLHAGMPLTREKFATFRVLYKQPSRKDLSRHVFILSGEQMKARVRGGGGLSDIVLDQLSLLHSFDGRDRAAYKSRKVRALKRILPCAFCVH